MAASELLFGFDLEDVRSMIPHGDRYRDRLAENVRRVLDFLSCHDARCTFFTVGNVARRHPGLIAEIAERGHELACHGAEHTPLERLGRDGFRRDLEQNLADLDRAGVPSVAGFRSPVGSLTAQTPWAHEVLAELGFRYSSSVIPGPNPLYSWPGFGRGCRRTEPGVWEIPVTTSRIPGLDVAYCGGVHLRVLPFALVRRLYRRDAAGQGYVTSHLHPYDVDLQQERFMHPELGDSAFLNALMYVGRGRVLGRFEKLILQEGARITRYCDFVDAREEAAEAA